MHFDKHFYPVLNRLRAESVNDTRLNVANVHGLSHQLCDTLAELSATV